MFNTYIGYLNCGNDMSYVYKGSYCSPYSGFTSIPINFTASKTTHSICCITCILVRPEPGKVPTVLITLALRSILVYKANVR